MNYSKKRKEETFIIKIKDGQHNTWQGSVLWVDEQNEKTAYTNVQRSPLLYNASNYSDH